MRPSVLVVEDDHATQTLLTVLLNRAGLDVDAIGSGSDAITLLGSVKYSAVLFDLQLPGVSGHEILEFLDGHDSEMLEHAIVLSSGKESDLERIRKQFTQTYVIRKPFDLQELTNAVVTAAANRFHGARTIDEEFCRLSIVNGAKAGVIYVADRDKQQLNLAGSFGYPPDMIRQYTPVEAEAPLPACAAFRHRSPVWLTSPSMSASEYPQLQAIWRENHSYALAAIPLIRAGEVFGAAGWTFREPRVFTESERQRFEAIATILSSEL